MAKIIPKRKKINGKDYITNYTIGLQKSKVEEFGYDKESDVDITYTNDIIILKKVK